MTPCDPPCDPLWRTGPGALVEERVDLDGGREEQASHVGRRLAGGGARPWGPQGLLAVALCSIGGGLLPGSGTIVMIALSTPRRLVLVDWCSLVMLALVYRCSCRHRAVVGNGRQKNADHYQ
eukprot:9475201-Pyramimonas_sp.AAC.1